MASVDGGRNENDRRQARLCQDLGAITFFASRIGSRGSNAAAFASAQRKAMGVTKVMTSAHVALVTRLTMPTELKRLHALAPALMVEAETAAQFTGPQRVAQRILRANSAVALAMQMQLLLMPCELQNCICMGEEADMIIRRSDGVSRIMPKSDLSERTLGLMQRSSALRANLGCTSEWLYARKDLLGPQDQKSVCTGLAKIMGKHEFDGVTIQVLRDVSAVAMIKEKPGNLRRVMILLGVGSIATVQRRYAPFLKGLHHGYS